MSRKQHTDAMLDGYQGPFFPQEAGPLQYLIETGMLSPRIIDEATSTVDGYYQAVGPRARPLTSDNYQWFWLVDIRRDNGQIAILFPWAQDIYLADESMADRSVAVYTLGTWDEDAIKAVVNDVATSLQMYILMLELNRPND